MTREGAQALSGPRFEKLAISVQMSEKPYKIVGLGEVLFDCLPSRKKMLGGAPANFAYVSRRLGDDAALLSRVGDDAFGREILRALAEKNLSTRHLQIDREKPTGVVVVALRGGQPAYEIAADVAWDFLELTDAWRATALETDAVCFGSLAQRGETSRQTIHEFVALTKGLRIFDVNLRQNYFSAPLLRRSFELADAVKCSHEELPVVAEMFDAAGASALDSAENLRRRFDLDLMAVTCGAKGSFLLRSGEVSENPGFKIDVADTIGAGDAFTAAMTHGLLRGWSLDRINELANRVGAFVASKAGAMPDFAEIEKPPVANSVAGDASV